jgi:hypothetical protein
VVNFLIPKTLHMRHSIFLLFILFASVQSFSQEAQRPEMKFGDIKPADFAPTVYSIDSSAQAVILFEVQKVEYEGDNQGGFSVLYKLHRRIRLLSKNAFDEATIEIPMFTSNQYEDELKKLEAVTYNLEDGKVVSVKVDKGSIYKDKMTKGFYVKKFTFPGLKEGSIIEYQYTLASPFERMLIPWSFQDTKHPTLWSEYDLTVPDLYNFLPVPRVFYPYAIEKQEQSNASYRIVNRYASYRDNTSFTYNAVNTRRVWALANIPALKEESYTTSLNNYVSQINFYLLSINYPGQVPIPIIKDWYKTAEDLLKNENFGGPLSDNNGWLKDDLEKILAGAVSDEDKIKAIYYYVRNNIECTNDRQFFLTQSLKKTMQEKKGTVGDINILLAAICAKAGFTTHPVLLSTRRHGKPYEAYPVLNQFDYVVAQVISADKTYLLDAADKKNAFARLPEKCYNGTARIIDQTAPELIDLVADSVTEAKQTSIFIINDPKTKGLAASYSSALGYYESIDLREKLVKQTQEDYFKEIKKGFSFETQLSNTTIDSLKNNDYTVNVKFDFKLTPDDDLLYINPMFTEAQKENPFKSANRYYPVEMPYKIYETYVLNMEVPEGYKVDEIPKSARVKLNEDEGMFEYIIAQNGTNIQLRSKIVLYKATFQPEDYQILRDFFAFIVKKHSEQIVLKKTK